MSQPSLEEVRELSEWRPELGVLSVYLGFDPADRTGAWRTELRNGLEAILEAHKEVAHDQRQALRATAKRLVERFEDGDLRPPPRGEAGFVAVSEKGGGERWWGAGTAPAAEACVAYGPEPAVASLMALCCRGAARGVALISSERVRLLRCAEAALEEVEDWELSIFSLDWRERKSASSSGHDQFGERLDHNRQRFLAECGGLATRRLERDGLDQVVVFGHAKDVESFNAGFGSARVKLAPGGEQDLISVPKGQLSEVVADVIERLDSERDRALVERVLGEVNGGSRGSAGIQETREALLEGRVDHLVLDATIDGDREQLVRAALAGSAQVTIVRDELAQPLADAEGVAAILRY
jgi:Bacterial archaeo-eukaryotic release factor family 10